MKNKITIVTVLLFLLTAAFSAMAQTKPDLAVSDPKGIYDITRNVSVTRTNLSASNLNPGPSPDPIQQLSALFQNMGSKTIKSVIWEFIFYRDADAKGEIEQIYTLRNKTKILPNQSLRLTQTGHYYVYPTPRVNVTRIEYTDGTMWEGVKTKK